MSIRTWFRFLIGDRQAILDIAADRQAVLVGGVFVLSAGIAREYDQEDLLHEPWYLLIPFAVSLVASFLLFCVSFGILKAKSAKPAPSFGAAYLMFLGLFWMTGPIAWLYVIPYERFLTPFQATSANLWTLGLVALWRVGLMIRVTSVLMNYPWFAAAGVVMLLADVEALIGLSFLPWPLLDMMGGLMMSDNESLKREAACLVLQAGIFSLPLWLIGFGYALTRKDLAWQGPLEQQSSSRFNGLMMLALASVLIWAPILPATQPAMMRKREVEALFEEGKIPEALAEMSRRDRSEYPLIWEPPPLHAELQPKIEVVLGALGQQPIAPWVVDIYLHKVDRIRTNRFQFHGTDAKKDLARKIALLPGGPEMLKRWAADDGHDGEAWRKILTEIEAEDSQKSP